MTTQRDATGELADAPRVERRSPPLALSHRTRIVLGRLVLLALVIALWEALARNNILPAAFIGQPSVFLPLLVAR
ncbi:MAG TPA: hypothetical protein VMV45_21665, partial [Casimicrobiaceae bacterium]|nr:hypothetical protein [Casimicrobiaceae bacterium]